MKINQVMPKVGLEELRNLEISIDRAWLTEGPFTESFITEVKRISGAKFALPVNNGTLGLYLSLLSLDLEKGSEVLVPSFTFFGSVSSIYFAGLKPVFVDVDRNNYMSTVKNFKTALTAKTKAIMPIHIYGMAADMNPIMSFAKENNLKVIEDAAQGMGVHFKDKYCGTFGDIGVLSFYADKTITMGEGGVVLTNSEGIFEKAKLIRNQGRPNSGTFIHSDFGMNFRITDMQAGVGLAQIGRLPEIEKSRLERFQLYKNELSCIEDIRPIKSPVNGNFIPFRFAFTSNYKNKIELKLNDNGIQTRSFFYPMHIQPAVVKSFGIQKPQQVSEKLYEKGLCLPVHHEVSKDNIISICDLIKQVY